MLAAVRQDCDVLHDAPAELLEDEELLAVAVQQDSHAMRYAARPRGGRGGSDGW